MDLLQVEVVGIITRIVSSPLVMLVDMEAVEGIGLSLLLQLHGRAMRASLAVVDMDMRPLRDKHYRMGLLREEEVLVCQVAREDRDFRVIWLIFGGF